VPVFEKSISATSAAERLIAQSDVDEASMLHSSGKPEEARANASYRLPACALVGATDLKVIV